MGSNPAVLIRPRHRMNPLLADAAARRAAGLPVLDLSDTNFHRNGLRYPDERLARHFADYVAERSYDPDPRGRTGTRERIAEWYASHGIPVDPERIFLTASTSESYALIFQALLSAGESVLLPKPTYPLFAHLCEYARVTPVYYSLDVERSFAPDFAEVEARLAAGAAACVTISPNNPTGAVLSPSEEVRFEELCARHGAVLIRDEVFRGFEWDDGYSRAGVDCRRQSGGAHVREGTSRAGAERPGGDAAGAAPPAAGEMSSTAVPGAVSPGFGLETGPPRFRLGGVSKLFASPDLKLAWICTEGADRQPALPAGGSVIERLELANDTYLNASSASQFVVEHMFAAGADVPATLRAALARRHALVDEVLAGAGCTRPGGGPTPGGGVCGSDGDRGAGAEQARTPSGRAPRIRVRPQAGGIHRVLHVPGVDDEAVARDLLRESGVLVHPGYFYDFPDDGFLVISTVPSEEVLRKGLEAIGRFSR